MSGLKPEEVRVATTGAVYVGPEGTAAPADTQSTIAGMKDLGYVSEDGVVETRDRSTEKIKGWQHAATLREIVTEADYTLKFTLVQTNKDTVELYYGTKVDPASGSLVINPAAQGERQAFCLDVIDGDDFIRVWIPQGQVTEVGEQKYVNGEAIGYEVTVAAYMTVIDGQNGCAKKFYSSLKTSGPTPTPTP